MHGCAVCIANVAYPLSAMTASTHSELPSRSIVAPSPEPPLATSAADEAVQAYIDDVDEREVLEDRPPNRLKGTFRSELAGVDVSHSHIPRSAAAAARCQLLFEHDQSPYLSMSAWEYLVNAPLTACRSSRAMTSEGPWSP